MRPLQIEVSVYATSEREREGKGLTRIIADTNEALRDLGTAMLSHWIADQPSPLGNEDRS